MNAPRPSSESTPAEERRAMLSALADGEAAAEPGCALWRDDAQARATWHAYHLIGDVMRSDDLAARPARDAAFLASLRERLAAEPVVLAPAPAVVPRRQAWLRRAAVPAAMAAGFVAVAGVLVVARAPAPGADGPLVAVGTRPNPALQLTGAAAAPPQPLVISGRFVRDPQLDAYLRAHRDAMGGVPAALPGGMPRNIETLAPAGPAAAPATR